ncbi:MAG TPA: hypothetical protein VIO11_09535 [Candidatus Methanoperedens sp.]
MKSTIMEKVSNLGVGVLFVMLGAFLVVLMIAYLLYNIFILRQS